MEFKTYRRMNYIFSYIFMFSAFILLILGVVFTNIHNDRVKNWKEIEAKITYIDHEDEYIIVTYYNDGYSNSKQIFNYSSAYRVGDDFKLYEENDVIYAGGFKIGFIVCYSLAAVFGLTGTISFIVFKKSDKNKEICLKNGIKRKAKVSKIYKTNYKNGIYCYRRMLIFYNDKKYKSIYFTVPKNFEEIKNAVVDIYILDSGKYYIDIDSYRENNIEIF